MDSTISPQQNTPWQAPTNPLTAVPAMRYQENASALAQMTTIGVGGQVEKVVKVTARDEFIAALTEITQAGEELLVVGGGSNILAGDAPFHGTVIHDARNEIQLLSNDACGGAQIRVAAGTPWDEVVTFAIAHDFSGLECLSGIPGTAGAAPVQNIGAYGADVSKVIARVRTWDRVTQSQRTFFGSDLKFGYRNSILKESINSGKWGKSPRWIVLDLDLQLPQADLSAPIQYTQLATQLETQLGQRVPTRTVREAVLTLRKSKGMVLDDTDRDTYSLGSFFTNPVLSAAAAAKLPAAAPRFSVADIRTRQENTAQKNTGQEIGAAAPQIPGQIKTSAAWLIAHAGFQPGYGLPGRAALSTKHTLALTNRGEAKAADIAALAREIRDGVMEKFGVKLVPEPVTLGIEI